VARRATRARRLVRVAGRPGWAGVVVQRRATSWRCQRRIVPGVMSRPRRRGVGSSRVSAAIRARSDPVHWWAWGASLEHGELVAQDQDLDLPAGVGSSPEHNPAQERGEHLVDQPQRHRRIRACQDVCVNESVSSSRVSQFAGASCRPAGRRDTPMSCRFVDHRESTASKMVFGTPPASSMMTST
jgi:hypothetical protein